MNSNRWRVVVPVAAALAAASLGCSKSKADGSTAVPTAPEQVEGAERATGTGTGAGTGAGTGTGTGTGAGTGTGTGDIVAIGGDKEAVVATGKQPVAETAEYTLRLSVPETIAPGAEAVVTLDITPKKGWHLNLEFPTKLTVTAPDGVTVKKAEQVLADATRWTADAGQFSVRFTAAAAGDKAFSGKFKFAVCTDSTCDPKKEELAFSVAVQ